MLTTLLVAFASASLPAQSTIYVDASATPPGLGTLASPYARLDFAVSQAPTNAFISVAPGNYPNTAATLDSKVLSIAGPAGGPRPVIGAAVGGPVFDVGPTSSLALSELRLEGGDGVSSGSSTSGGAIHGQSCGLNLTSCSIAGASADLGGAIFLGDAAGPSTLSLFDVEIEASCSSETFGGAIMTMGAFDALIYRCTIEASNTSADIFAGGGGCIAALGVLGFPSTSRLDVRESTLSGTTGGTGGAILARDTNLQVFGSRVQGRTDYLGGGIFFERGVLLCGSVLFQGGEAQRGGALLLRSASSAQVDTSTFRDNGTGPVSGRGGAIYSEGDLQVISCLFENNRADGTPSSTGGAVAGWATVEQCTLVGNRAGSDGGTFYREPFAPLEVVGCILADATVPGVAAANQGVMISHSLVDTPNPGVNLTVGDPLFWSTAPGAEDYHLLPGSPAIDAYDPAAFPDAFGTIPDVGLFPFDPFYCGAGCDGPLGQVACAGVQNSTGAPARTSAVGSLDPARNLLILTVRDLPSGSFGYFIASQTPDLRPGAGGSSGTLCLGGSVLRFDRDVQRATPVGGFASLKPDLSSLPFGGSVGTGETWYFQYWHRDSAPGGGLTSNFSPSLQIDY